MVFRIISGVDEDHLLCKLLEMANPILEDVKKKIAFWEVARITKNITNQKHIAKLVITICNTQVSLSAPIIKRKKLSKLPNLWKGLKHLL